MKRRSLFSKAVPSAASARRVVGRRMVACESGAAVVAGCGSGTAAVRQRCGSGSSAEAVAHRFVPGEQWPHVVEAWVCHAVEQGAAPPVHADMPFRHAVDAQQAFNACQ